MLFCYVKGLKLSNAGKVFVDRKISTFDRFHLFSAVLTSLSFRKKLKVNLVCNMWFWFLVATSPLLIHIYRKQIIYLKLHSMRSVSSSACLRK